MNQQWLYAATPIHQSAICLDSFPVKWVGWVSSEMESGSLGFSRFSWVGQEPETMLSLLAESLLTEMSWNKRKPSQPAKCHGKSTSTASQLSHKINLPWPGEKCGSTLSERNVFQQWEQLIAWNQKIRDLVMGPCYSALNCCNQLITYNSIHISNKTN